jgi:hypothetical protein
VPFYFINLLQTSLLYISILLAGAGVVAKVHAVFLATALSKRVVMVVGERGEYGDLET